MTVTCLQDIAVLTNNASRCRYYQENSQNVRSRYYCALPQSYINANLNPNRNREQPIPIDQETCEVNLFVCLFVCCLLVCKPGYASSYTLDYSKITFIVYATSKILWLYCWRGKGSFDSLFHALDY